MKRIIIILLSQVLLTVFVTILSLWETVAMFLIGSPLINTAFESLFYAGVAFGFGGGIRSLKRRLVWPAGKPVLKSILNWALLSAALTIGGALAWQLTPGFFDPSPTINAERGIHSVLFPLLVMCGLAPFAEEWLFRGYLQSDLVSRWGNVKGIAATALVFALLHSYFLQNMAFLIYWHLSGMGDGMNSVGALFGPSLGGILTKTGHSLILHLPSGLLYGYLAYREKSLWPAFIAHSTHNLFVASGWNYGNFAGLLDSSFGMRNPGLLPYIVLGICFYILYRGVVKI